MKKLLQARRDLRKESQFWHLAIQRIHNQKQVENHSHRQSQKPRAFKNVNFIDTDLPAWYRN